MNGKVFLVGAGPGDPELLTVKAFRILQSADAVLHDDMISPEILALIPKTAEVRNVGKRCGRKSIQQEEINALLVTFAFFGLKVVRLKAGDPLIFGRAGEEMELSMPRWEEEPETLVVGTPARNPGTPDDRSAIVAGHEPCVLLG